MQPMMIVPAYVGPSAIEGVGIFATDPIVAGTAIWTLDERFDQLFHPSDLDAMNDLQRSFIERYGYPHMTRAGLTVVEFDNGRFMNHAEEPNTDFTDPNIGWAIRDIAAGDEITCDYREFDPSFVIQPGRRFLTQDASISSSVSVA
jgi:SET domain-containing protein